MFNHSVLNILSLLSTRAAEHDSGLPINPLVRVALSRRAAGLITERNPVV